MFGGQTGSASNLDRKRARGARAKPDARYPLECREGSVVELSSCNSIMSGQRDGALMIGS